MTQVMKASEVRQQWSKLLNKVFRNQTRVVVEKSGIPIAAVISAQDLKLLAQLEKQRDQRFKALDKIREAFKDIPQKEVEKEVEKALFQIRASRGLKNGRN